jgi:hypothetical protein
MSFSPLTRAQFLLLGGWSRNAIIIGASLAIVAVSAGVTYRAVPPADHDNVHRFFLSATGIFQAVFLLLVAPNSIRRAVLRDFETGMIYSHRLTPLGGWRLVLGYMTGGGAQSGLLFATGILLGSVFAYWSGQIVQFGPTYVWSWVYSQACLLTLALLVNSLALLSALGSRGKMNLLPIFLLGALFGGWFVIFLIPGLALLSGVMSVGVFFQFLGVPGPGGLDPRVTVWAVLFQVALSGVILAAASRKVRRPEGIAFTPLLSTLLLATWGLLLVVGRKHFTDFAGFFGGDESYAIPQWIGSTLAFMLVALVPVSARALRDGRSYFAGDSLPLLGWLTPVAVSAAAFVVAVVTAPLDVAQLLEANPLRSIVPVAIVIGCAFLVDYAACACASSRAISQRYALLATWGVLRGVPFLVDGLVFLVSEIIETESGTNWSVSSISLIGTLIQASDGDVVQTGVAIQVALAIAAIVLWRWAFTRRSAPVKDLLPESS